MAITKLTKSGKAVQFIDESGNVFQTSVIYLQSLIEGNLRGNFILLNLLPFKVATDRFKPSPLYNPKQERVEERTLTTTNDALSQKSIKASEQKKQFEDKSVW